MEVQWPDLINGLFELCAGSLLALNVRQLHRDKRVQGVHILPTIVFAAWGYYNLYFYPHLGQWLSFLGGIVMVTLNTIWIGQMVYFHPKRLSWR